MDLLANDSLIKRNGEKEKGQEREKKRKRESSPKQTKEKRSSFEKEKKEKKERKTKEMKTTYKMCIECEDVPAIVECQECQDIFCGLCFEWLHRSGTRASHTPSRLQDVPLSLRSESSASIGPFRVKQKREEEDESEPLEGTTEYFEKEFLAKNQGEAAKEGKKEKKEVKAEKREVKTEKKSAMGRDVSLKELVNRCSSIPLRLTAEERVLLHILEGSLDVSEYTDNVDVASNPFGWRSIFDSGVSKKEGKMKKELIDFFSYINGLFVCSNLRRGKKLIDGKRFRDNAKFLSTVFEIGRRYKIMNPDKMRTTYGKLMYILMDTVACPLLDFSVVEKIKTVGDVFSTYAPSLLNDPRLLDAVMEVNGEEQATLRKNTRSTLYEKYSNKDLDVHTLERCFDSICDSNSYIHFNRTPVERAISFLREKFDSSHAKDKLHSLEIQHGIGGSRLSHSHKVQYQFVMQTLLLWREIQGNMYSLWLSADSDLLSSKHPYRLVNTGQGLNRVQPAPRVGKQMSGILSRIQKKMGGWVGLSVVHLGDRDVPNALIFIDKYTQVPRILGPLIQTLDQLIVVCESDKRIREWTKKVYGGPQNATRWVLRDYFRYGFDGSGDDGGSCVDGRLTSSWNWCSKLEKKKFHPLFLLTGFEGFNGSFKK